MDKLTRKLEYRDKLYSRLVGLRKKIVLLDKEIDYLEEVNALLQEDNAALLGSTEAPRAGLRSEDSRQVQGLPEPTKNPPPKPKPKQASGPKCNSCGAVGTLFRTSRTLQNGKVVPLAVCDGCKTEQVAIGF